MEREFLKEHFMFRRVTAQQLEELLSGASAISVNRGETVYDRTCFQRSLGILLEGVLRVKKDALLISTLRAGEVFGAAALFNEGGDYPTTLTAMADSRLLLIPQEGVSRLIRTNGGFAEDYVTYLSGRIRFLSTRLDAVTADRGENKLARYLAAAGRETITQSATQLCQRIGVGRATLYRAFERLESDGAIRREGKIIHVLDSQKLRAHGDAAY